MTSLTLALNKSEHDLSNHASPTSIVNLLRLPGENRNQIYDLVICSLPQATTVRFLPAIAYVSMLVHQEFMSQYLLQMHFEITSMQDIWRIQMLLHDHSKISSWQRITRMTITNFTSIAHTPSRANEVMDFMSHFKSPQHLALDITLKHLYHGFQGRIKNVNRIIRDFELFRLFLFTSLRCLVIDVKRGSLSQTPESVSLLSELEEVFINEMGAGVIYVHSE